MGRLFDRQQKSHDKPQAPARALPPLAPPPTLKPGSVFVPADERDQATPKPPPKPRREGRVPRDQLPPTLTESLAAAEKTDASTAAGEVDVKKRLAKIARQIKTAKRQAVQAILVIGESLIEARTLLADHDGGSYGKWLQSCGLSRPSAHRYICAFQVFGGCVSEIQRIETQAVYLLSAPQTPKEAVDDALEVVQGGGNVTAKTARQILTKHLPPKIKDARPDPIFVETDDAMIVIKPKREGVDAKSVLAQALRQFIDEPAKRAA